MTNNPTMTATFIETGSIQNFIFGSNKLREMIGASELVFQVTSDWLQIVLTDIVASHNFVPTGKSLVGDWYTDYAIEHVDAAKAHCEVVYAGGGNAFLLFAGQGHAKTAHDVVYALSKRVLLDAPGLQLFATHDHEFIWNGDRSLVTIRKTFSKTIALSKSQLFGANTLQGLSVTAECTSTGLAANQSIKDDDNSASRLVSRQTAIKQDETLLGKYAKARLRGLLPEVEEDENSVFKWSDDLDRLARLRKAKEESYIGVVHADGNGMGKRIIALGNAYANGKDTRAYINALRAMSASFADTATRALRRTLLDVYTSLQSSTKEIRLERAAPADKNEQDPRDFLFPIRPLVFGGDDVTLVTVGQWGLEVAKRYLENLAKEELAEVPTGEDATPYASAGVAIVKTHFPLSRAYSVSEALAKSAKTFALQQNKNKYAFTLDWHFTTSGLSGNLADIRAREYTFNLTPQDIKRKVDQLDDEAQEKARECEKSFARLNLRPVTVTDKDKHPVRNWQNVITAQTFLENKWLNSRNKLLRLRDALRDGPVAVAQYRQLLGFANSDQRWPQLNNAHSTDGWATDFEYGKTPNIKYLRCLLFDAVELANFSVDIDSSAVEDVA